MAKNVKAPAWLKRRIEDAWTIPTLDVLFAMLMLLVMLPHAKADNPSDPPPGTLVVEIVWPFAQDADVDLWVAAPGDVPVGYSNKGGLIFNLLRDDLGSYTADILPVNYEVTYSRGVVDGEYQVNVHLYRNRGATLPIKVVVRVKLNQNNSTRLLHTKNVALETQGQEITVFRWDMRDGQEVAGSLHDIPRALRPAIGPM